jgi:hypothetical protein
MCPACIASALWIAAGTASTGGLAAVVAIGLHGKKGDKESDEHTHDQGDSHGNAESGFTR